MIEIILIQFITENLPKHHTANYGYSYPYVSYNIYDELGRLTARIERNETNLHCSSIHRNPITHTINLNDPNSIATLEQWLKNLNQ